MAETGKGNTEKLNIQDISRLTGVSTATVSRVLNGSDKVSPRTYERVMQVIRETGYVPNAFAQGLRRDTTRTVGIICSDTTDYYVTSAVFYMEHELNSGGYVSLLVCAGYELKDRQRAMKLLLSKRVDTVVLLGSTLVERDEKDNQYIYDASREVPIIHINGCLEGENIYNVYCDDQEVTYRATRAVLAADPRRRAIFTYHMPSYSNLLKLKGFLRAMEEFGQEIRGDTVILSPREELASAMDRVFRGVPEEEWPGAVITSGDTMAIRALKYFRVNGIRVPEQVQVVGYNNSNISSYCVPELTSIDCRIDDLARMAARVIFQVLKGENVSRKKALNGILVFRESTLPEVAETAGGMYCDKPELLTLKREG